MTSKDVIEVVAALTALAGVVGLLIQRFKANKSIGARAVQFAVAVLLIPTVLILGLEKAMTDATLGTLLGGIAGYVLSRVGEFQPNQAGSAE